MDKNTKTTLADNSKGQKPRSIGPTTSKTATNSRSSSEAADTALAAFFSKKAKRKLAMLVLLPVLAGITGCGSSVDPDRLPVFPAKGQITFQGKSLNGAFVVLHPQGAKGSREARPRGHVTEDGKFSLSTYETNDGAPAGEYKVTVECRSLVKRPSGDIVAGPNVLPKKYSRPETSPVTLRIAEGDNSLSPIILK
jgi:hypothetical protein